MRDSKGDFRGDFKQNMEGDLLSSSGQVRSRSGLVQAWFSLQPKFNSFELDSEVGQLVFSTIKYVGNIYIVNIYPVAYYYFHISVPSSQVLR